ncbi:MAG: hypothetical protein FJY42_04905 [Betaproteobacteria bacterium]|nr:hypothetical protein [Betaproteobacteria bacterium]
MELKRILARDTRSAMEQAIKTYGPDVLVISNHQVGGQTELVVAIEADTPLQAQGLASEPAAPATASAPQAKDGSSPDFRKSLQAAWLPVGRPLPAPGEGAAIAPERSEEDARDYLRGREIVDLVRDEIAALRREFRMRQQTSAWQSGLNLTPAVAPLAQALQDAEIPGALLALLLDGVSQAGDLPQALQILREQLLHPLMRPAAPMPARGIHLLAGPSGAGKSLMAARIARQAAQAGCDRVALISFQDVRAGAWSQMQMLAAQLGVDAFRAHDGQSLKLLLEELSPRSLILIDTPGVQMADQVRQVLALAPACQCHAVVPLDASAATLQRVFGPGLPFASLMLTKVDEAASGWALLQFLSNNPLTISVASRGAGLGDLSSDFDINQLVDFALSPIQAAVNPDHLAPFLPRSDAQAVGSGQEPLAAALASIAQLPAVPAFLSTADILGGGAAKKTTRASAKRSPAKATDKSRGKTVAAQSPARKRETERAAPAGRSTRRKAAEVAARS